MLKNPFVLTVVSIVVIGFSIHLDLGHSSWQWFQRSGSIVTVLGAILGIRSFFRLGIKGIGGATPFGGIGTVKGTRMVRGKLMVDFELDEESKKAEREDERDKLSMVIGILHIVLGTIIWGYGDLLGSIIH